MIRFHSFLAIIVLISINITGCSVARNARARDCNEKIVMSMQVGMSKEQVLTLLGTPRERESYGGREVWFYVTKPFPSAQLENTKLVTTPIAFENNKVIGWGNKFTDDPDTKKIKADIHINR